MTNERKRDLLLWAVSVWQNGGSVYNDCRDPIEVRESVGEIIDSDIPIESWESACLSEAAGLGFDLETVE